LLNLNHLKLNHLKLFENYKFKIENYRLFIWIPKQVGNDRAKIRYKLIVISVYHIFHKIKKLPVVGREQVRLLWILF